VALYSSVIRDRFRNPRYRGAVAEPDAVFEDVNPLCGDRIRIECRVADGQLSEARFTGDSCAIAAASADVLIEMALGHSAQQIQDVTAGQVLERLQADIRPARMKCVTLPLTVLRGALAAKEVSR
jgi:nitrogen fixation protein NifU and related proteins